MFPWFSPASREPGGAPSGARGFGHQYTQFALPTAAGGEHSDFFLAPLVRDLAIVMPLWLVAPDLRALLLAPLDSFHEQVIAVPRGVERAADGVRCGWHGELAVFGDTRVFACAGDRRIRELRAHAGGVALDVLGAPGERVAISGWCERAVEARVVDPVQRADFAHDRGSGRFELALEIPDRGYACLELR